MKRPTTLQRFESALEPRVSPHDAACRITALAPRLPEQAIAVMDVHLAAAHPLVQVAIIDAYFTLTGCDYHIDDLARIQATALRAHDEDVYAAATIALARQAGEPEGTWVERGFEILGVSAPSGRPRRKGLAAPRPPETITIMIHGTWASDGSWWRPGGDFFEYVRTDLGLDDLYGKQDQFKWSGRNRDSSRDKAARELHQWIASHKAASVRVFAHSHGANIASLATREGARLDRLVMLSPPVRKDYLPTWKNVGEAYNIQARFDAVVAIAQGGQWFKDVMKPGRVRERKLKSRGHSASHDPEVWKQERLANFVGLPWD